MARHLSCFSVCFCLALFAVGCGPVRWAIAQERDAQARYQSMTPEQRAAFDRDIETRRREEQRDLEFRREQVEIHNRIETLKWMENPSYETKYQDRPVF